MPNIDNFKDIVVDEIDYRITPLSPTAGAMMIAQMTSGKMLVDEDIFNVVSRSCLDVVSVLVEKKGQKMPLKLYSKAANKWQMPEITNPATILSLVMEVVNFNLQPFMKPATAPASLAGNQDTLQSASLTGSAPTPGDLSSSASGDNAN